MLTKIASLLTLLAAAMLYQTAYAVPASFQWGSYSAAGTTGYGVYDSDNVTPLDSGDLVQLIWVGADGLAAVPNADGSPGGDDLLLATTAVQNGGSFPPPLQNKGYVPLATLTFDSDDTYVGGTVYLRAWNATTAAGATAYGDSEKATLSDHGSFNATRWHTNAAPTAVTLQSAATGSAVPLPLLLALALLLLTAAMIRRRRP